MDLEHLRSLFRDNDDEWELSIECKKRMKERKVTIEQLLYAVEHGNLHSEQPTQGKGKKIKIQGCPDSESSEPLVVEIGLSDPITFVSVSWPERSTRKHK